MFFPDNSIIRRDANDALALMGLSTGSAKIRENKRAAKSKRPAFDVLYKAPGAAKGRVVFTLFF